MTTLLTMKGFNKKIDYLCFTANTAGSTVKLRKFRSPTSVNIETSTNKSTWTDYTIWDTITLSNVWDKIYFRNKSETTTGFSTSPSDSYRFEMTWSVAWSWDVNYLINKNSTDTLVWNYCYFGLFEVCTSLTTAPELPATTLTEHCYQEMFYYCTNLETLTALPATTLTTFCYCMMFYWCTSLISCPSISATTLATSCCRNMFYNCSNLETLPKLQALALANYCYYQMFQGCTKIKMSTTKTWAYQTEYRIPTEWTWTTATDAFNYMFQNTWWTFTWSPTINTTYYTSNTVI